MIPKIIHYCWFGGTEMPEEYKAYIKEWRKIHPDWSFMLWNEVSFPMDSPYMANAIRHESWANASNYVRIKALYEYGGIYMDTDFKVLKPLTELLSNQCFLGFEEGESGVEEFWVNNAIMGAVPNHEFLKACLYTIENEYDGSEVANEAGPKLATQVLKTQFGLSEYRFQTLKNDVTVFEKDVFYPIPWNLAKRTANYIDYISDNTLAVHMWGRTWFTKEMMLTMIDDLQAAIYYKNNYIKELEGELKSLKGL